MGFFWTAKESRIGTTQPDEPPTSEDRLLGGRVALRQPRDGYRAAIDPVILAAAIDARAGALILDAGTGAGAAALCLLARRPDLRVVGIEIDPVVAALAERNAADNHAGDRLSIRRGDLVSLARAMSVAGERVDGVMTNPPHLMAERATPSPRADRARANVESIALADWVAACVGPLHNKGSLTMIHRADRIDDILLALRGANMGETAILPLWPRHGDAARRVLVRARKNVAAAASLLPGLVLHEVNGGYTAAADAILRDAAALDWKGSTSTPMSSC